MVEEPQPDLKSGHMLVQTSASLISVGTERMLVEFGKAGYVAKARSQPDKVKQVIEKVRTDGMIPAVQAVRSKLGKPLPLGYCNVGEIRQVQGSGFKGLRWGIGWSIMVALGAFLMKGQFLKVADSWQ